MSAVSPHRVGPDSLRAKFSAAMSAMYRREVPLYGTLIELVNQVNAKVLAEQPELAASLHASGEIQRLGEERHGAIRVGTATELRWLTRMFALMGMEPVGYYDLAAAGVPVHSTAFRPTSEDALRASPFRLFTSLLRLELIADPDLRQRASDILQRRQILSPQAVALIEQGELDGGFDAADGDAFVAAIVETFRWQQQASVDVATYEALRAAHPLIADVVCFRGPHINHLTPRTLDIDQVQALMASHGIDPKLLIEGPPPRAWPLLLRQTSFKALRETIAFPRADGQLDDGAHTARFGEIEQRGVALTRAGRELYDQCLAKAGGQGGAVLAEAFADFPDQWPALQQAGLVYQRYRAANPGPGSHGGLPDSFEGLLAAGWIEALPQTYEDFLPVSAAGIFQSNLGAGGRGHYAEPAQRQHLEAALGRPLVDEYAWYAQLQQHSRERAEAAVRHG